MNKTQKTLYYLGKGLIVLGTISFIFWTMTSQNYGINHTFIILFTCDTIVLVGIVLFEVFFSTGKVGYKEIKIKSKKLNL